MSVLLFGSSAHPIGTQKRTIYDAFIPWAIKRIPHAWKAGVRDFGEAVVFVVATKGIPDGKVQAVVVFHNYSPAYKTIEVSMAADSPMWAKKPAISTMLNYVFNEIGCERLQAVTAKRGPGPKHARRFLEHLGFKYEGVGRRAFGSDDAVMFSMLREDAQYWLTGIAYGEEGWRRARCA